MRGRLVAILGTAILAFLAVAAENFGVANPARIILGILLVFILPGFGLVCALLPGAEISLSERLLASLGTSLAVTICSAVLLGATIGITRKSIAIILGCLAIAAAICAFCRTYQVQRGRGQISEWRR